MPGFEYFKSTECWLGLNIDFPKWKRMDQHSVRFGLLFSYKTLNTM